MRTAQLSLLLCVLLATGIRAADSLEAALDEKIAPVLPKSDEEKWLQIPWRTDFAAARIEANESGKPLFLWMMDGNPLGCT